MPNLTPDNIHLNLEQAAKCVGLSTPALVMRRKRGVGPIFKTVYGENGRPHLEISLSKLKKWADATKGITWRAEEEQRFLAKVNCESNTLIPSVLEDISIARDIHMMNIREGHVTPKKASKALDSLAKYETRIKSFLEAGDQKGAVKHANEYINDCPVGEKELRLETISRIQKRFSNKRSSEHLFLGVKDIRNTKEYMRQLPIDRILHYAAIGLATLRSSGASRKNRSSSSSSSDDNDSGPADPPHCYTFPPFLRTPTNQTFQNKAPPQSPL